MKEGILRNIAIFILFYFVLIFPTLASEKIINEEILIDRCADLPNDSLISLFNSAKGIDRGIIALFIASNQPSPSLYTKKCYAIFDSLCSESEKAIRKMLLGTSAAIMARDSDDEIKATKYVSKSLKYLDAAVDADSSNVLYRNFRISSLVGVPEIFHVNKRLLSDVAILKNVKEKDSSMKMAIASVAYRVGDLVEAMTYWQDVIETSSDRSPKKEVALKMMELINE